MSWAFFLKNLPTVISIGKEIYKAIDDASTSKQEALMKADRVKHAFASKDQAALNEIFRELSKQ